MDIARIETILVDSLGEMSDDLVARPGSEVVDVFIASFAYRVEKVHEHATEMVELLKDWPTESFGQPIPALGEEISYKQAGRALDDQHRALMLFGFGKVLGWWDILDPYTVLGLDKTNPDAQEMANVGLVAISGYQPADTT